MTDVRDTFSAADAISIGDRQQLDEADLVHQHKAIYTRDLDAHRERVLHHHQEAVEHERDEDGGEGEDRPHLPAKQVPPDEWQVLHATVSISSPFSRCKTCVARSAACGSCVTMMMVLPCSRLSACRRSRISSPALRSRSPVGSSHSSSVGSVTIARAMPTRCSCPPESCRG